MAVTLQQIKDEYAKEKGYSDWTDIHTEVGSAGNWLSGSIDRIFTEIAKRYAEECCKATLEKAAQKAEAFDKYVPSMLGGYQRVHCDIDKSSITNPSNIVLL